MQKVPKKTNFQKRIFLAKKMAQQNMPRLSQQNKSKEFFPFSKKQHPHKTFFPDFEFLCLNDIMFFWKAMLQAYILPFLFALGLFLEFPFGTAFLPFELFF